MLELAREHRLEGIVSKLATSQPDYAPQIGERVSERVVLREPQRDGPPQGVQQRIDERVDTQTLPVPGHPAAPYPAGDAPWPDTALARPGVCISGPTEWDFAASADPATTRRRS
ncbi:hypothetical protein IU450_38105 [Nocardia abscessus]|uniref:hypothetical protein n=1 Tax=Nocardia abscessus TaxID=120957 RepID=UPI001894FC29|nr:hypothetical protein [Nocardia abscessus]MBF6341651.1 hypothetical protein [Nocardia abscessus]